MADFGISPARFLDPTIAPTVPVNLGSPGASAAVLPQFRGGWEGLLPQGPTAGNMISAAELGEKLRQTGRADQGRNMMAELYKNPANVDQNGMLKPQALSMLAANGFPDQALSVQSTMAEIGQKQQATRAAGEQFLDKQQSRILGEFEPLVAEYDNNVKTVGPERARQIGQERYSQLVEQAKTGGNYSPQILQRINPSFDPERLRANIVGLKGLADRQDKQEQFETRTDAGRSPPVEYRVYRDGRTTDLTGKATYTPTGVAEAKGAEAQLYVGKGPDGKEVTVKMGPTGGFVAAEGGRPVKDLTGIRKVGTKDEEGGQYGKVSQIAIEDPQSPGDTKIVPAQQDKKSGQWVTADANREPLPTPKRIVSTGGSGRQAEAQSMAMINAGNEATGSLKNLVELPIGATSGWFKGVSTQTPDSLAVAIGRGIAGQVNERDARSLQISWQGIGRSMATLEAAGRATGLVGLQKQAESLQPQKGDSYTNVLRSYAEIRQIIERSVETIKTSPGVSSDQKKLLTKIEDEAKTTVPWTVHDVNMLETGGKDSVLEFAKTVKVGAAGAKGDDQKTAAAPPLSVGSAPEVTEEQYNSLPAGAAYRVPGNPAVMYKR